MHNKSYTSPEIKVYEKDSDAIRETINRLSACTVHEICNIFSTGINENDYLKRCMDVADLAGIGKDIDKLNEPSNSLPEISEYTQMMAMIDMFINITEEKAGKRLNYYDFFNIQGICEDVNIIKPHQEYKNKITKYQNFNDIGFSNIITVIRNCLVHNRYIINCNGIYIHSKNARQKKTNKRDIDGNCIIEQQDFEAIISYEFLYKIIEFCTHADRKFKTSGIVMDNINRAKGFEKNKNIIEISSRESKKKGDIFASLTDIPINLETTRNIKKLSRGQKEFLSEYFKTHKFNRENLEFVNQFMIYNDNRIQLNTIFQHSPSLLDERNGIFSYIGGPDYMIDKNCFWNHASAPGYMMKWFTEGDNIDEWRIWGSDKYIEDEVKRKFSRIGCSPQEIFSIYNNQEAKRYLSDTGLRTLDEILPLKLKKGIINYIKDMKYKLLAIKDFNLAAKADYRKNYLKALYISKFYINNPKLKLAQPEERMGDKLWKQGRDFIINKCKKDPKSYWSKKAKEKHIDKILGDSYRNIIFKSLTDGKIDNWIIKSTDDIDQIINKINLFSTKRTKSLSPSQKEILTDNVRNIIKERKEKLDTTTIIGEEEHIRNAFAHHNYTILPGFNKILLWDPSRDDTPNWEGVYNLDELYNNCINKVDDCFLNSKTST